MTRHGLVGSFEAFGHNRPISHWDMTWVTLFIQWAVRIRRCLFTECLRHIFSYLLFLASCLLIMFPGDWICINVNTFYRECSGFPSFLRLVHFIKDAAMVPLRFWMLLSHFHFSRKWKTTIFLDKNHLLFLKCSHLLPRPLLPAGENIKRIQKQWKCGETSRARI